MPERLRMKTRDTTEVDTVVTLTLIAAVTDSVRQDPALAVDHFLALPLLV